MKITKMHGARNDFVIVDRRRGGRVDLARFAKWACDRRAGIGADGVIAIESSNLAGPRMRTINADGSEAEMCGNGVRCAARWLDEAGQGAAITFETEAGPISTEIVSRGSEYAVRVAMGCPAITPLSDGWFVDLGNPHVVLLRASIDDVDLKSVAEELQKDWQFTDGTNVHLAALQGPGAMHVAHWERGVGLTMACGTGAVACAAVAIANGTLTSPVEVFVPGGRLVVEWDGTGNAYLTGPAVRVFDTEVDFDDDLAP
ncbi:MAG TPA: diaminopimelate epimerase [Candidatus Cybelea sp.]|nr:diaminopimelate epimerase [Candidatus Cybelea sp.]